MLLSPTLWAFFLAISTSSAYIFTCLDDCNCDTDEEVIHCQNGARTELKLPDTRLRGFMVIAMNRNNLKHLPSEEMLKEKFPDLLAIDLDGNHEFDCNTLPHYSKVKLILNCSGEDDDRSNIVQEVGKPTDECNVACQLEKHLKSLQQYAKKIWIIVKQKVAKFDKDEFMQDVQDFFSKIAKKFANAQREFLKAKTNPQPKEADDS
ncbi:hypothetical protein L596_003306 [Steinernema carpocapsae]|uniref:LRRNT domain-containing protein n=1 Tax=Steinernema carpocapsae TaxID=34508 RepID=A0A4U8URU6_STECR|nr:hypothetical protein L596_003306 [Steinernema carpocapsae]